MNGYITAQKEVIDMRERVYLVENWNNYLRLEIGQADLHGVFSGISIEQQKVRGGDFPGIHIMLCESN